MNFKSTSAALLKKRLETSNEIITYSEPFITDTIDLFAQNSEDAIDYLKNDYSSEEYIWISELIDEIAAEAKNIALIQAYASLSQKYPQETKDYNIGSFIKSAISIAQSWQDNEM